MEGSFAMKQIVAMGGGGFSVEPDNLALDKYVLEQTGKPTPSVCFLPTASGDAPDYIVKFYTAFTTLQCSPSHLSLLWPPAFDLRSYLLEKDVIYVDGGQTRNMLALWREWGLDNVLREAWEAGVVLTGLSAGGICWFEEGLSDSVIPGKLARMVCLGLLPGSFCPHYDTEGERRPVYHRLVASEGILPGYGVGDGAALHFVGMELKRVVASRPDATAYRVEPLDRSASERALKAQHLLAGETPTRG
jgi:dipeptidase E